MKSREYHTAALADEIVDGCFWHPRICLASVLDDYEPLLNNEDMASFLSGNTETRLELLSRADCRARVIVRHWLTHNTRGISLIDERVEQEIEDVEDQARWGREDAA